MSLSVSEVFQTNCYFSLLNIFNRSASSYTDAVDWYYFHPRATDTVSLVKTFPHNNLYHKQQFEKVIHFLPYRRCGKKHIVHL